MMRGCLYLLAGPASSVGTKMQMTLCCTYDSRRTRRNDNRILSHRTPQSVRTVSVSLPPFPLPENSSVAVAHSQTCQKSLVFLPLHFEQQHRQTHVTPPLRIPIRHASRHMHQPTGTQSANATQPPRMMPPHTPTRRPATRRKHCLDTQNRLPQSTTAPSKQ
ncbi:hypothetical protein TcCL_NonESM05779 [Trypanosoma cruzi]|nr:hypothetical protein TcCL_NonESM05779 [Trypanosoma cruzi]